MHEAPLAHFTHVSPAALVISKRIVFHVDVNRVLSHMISKTWHWPTHFVTEMIRITSRLLCKRKDLCKINPRLFALIRSYMTCKPRFGQIVPTANVTNMSRLKRVEDPWQVLFYELLVSYSCVRFLELQRFYDHRR